MLFRNYQITWTLYLNAWKVKYNLNHILLSIFESIRENFADELTQVDGIGDEAFIATPGIHILKGDYYIVIGVGNSSDEDNRAILKTSGIRAVENLELLINK